MVAGALIALVPAAAMRERSVETVWRRCAAMPMVAASRYDSTNSFRSGNENQDPEVHSSAVADEALGGGNVDGFG